MKTLFENATFHTMEDAFDTHSSMLVDNGVIVGFDEHPHTGRAHRVDLGGAQVFPALIDAHLHLANSIALAALGQPLCTFTSGKVSPCDLAGVERKIRSSVSSHSNKKLFIFSNYSTASISEARLPTRFELDRWAQGAPVWVISMDGHSSSGSSALLEAIGLLEFTDEGIFTGADHDANVGIFIEHMTASITPQVLAQGIARFSNECAHYGIGTLCAHEGSDELIRDASTIWNARIAQRLQLDVRMFPQYMDMKKLQILQKYLRRPRAGGCMKWELDGSVGSRSAAFSKPYRDGSQGSLYFSKENLLQIVLKLDTSGYQISAHAIGDKAIDQYLDVFEQVDGCHRIDHCEFPTPKAVERLCALKPAITVQPGYAWIDRTILHGYERFLEPEQLAQQIPLAHLMRAGVTLCGSSDAPVQSVDPFLQMRGMRDFYRADQSLSAYEALATYTICGGRMLEEQKGVLRLGWEASFFTCQKNLLSLSPEGLEGTCANGLWLHGKPYRRLSAGLSTLAHLATSRPRLI